MRTILCFFIFTLFCGFARPYGDASLYQRNGRPKPIVAVFPVIDSLSEAAAPWSLSQEFTEEVSKRIFNSSKLYLLQQGGAREAAEQLLEPNLAILTKKWMGNLGATEFVIVAELLEQKEEPFGLNQEGRLKETGANLSLSVRLRILDLRKNAPEVILQEIITHQYKIARPYLHCDYAKHCWGKQSFERTPMGIAHGRMIQEIVARVEGYIGAAKG